MNQLVYENNWYHSTTTPPTQLKISSPLNTHIYVLLLQKIDPITSRPNQTLPQDFPLYFYVRKVIDQSTSFQFNNILKFISFWSKLHRNVSEEGGPTISQYNLTTFGATKFKSHGLKFVRLGAPKCTLK